MTKQSPDRDAIRKAFSVTLRTLRYRANLSQEGMALEAGIERGYMSGMERGLHTPSLEMILRMLPLLNVSFVEFAVEFDHALRKQIRSLRHR